MLVPALPSPKSRPRKGVAVSGLLPLPKPGGQHPAHSVPAKHPPRLPLLPVDSLHTLDPAVAAPAARQTDRPPALPEAGWPVLDAAAWTPVPVRFPRAHRPKTRVPAFALLSPDRPVGRKSVRPKDLPGWSAEFQFRGIFDRKP